MPIVTGQLTSTQGSHTSPPYWVLTLINLILWQISCGIVIIISRFLSNHKAIMGINVHLHALTYKYCSKWLRTAMFNNWSLKISSNNVVFRRNTINKCFMVPFVILIYMLYTGTESTSQAMIVENCPEKGPW